MRTPEAATTTIVNVRTFSGVKRLRFYNREFLFFSFALFHAGGLLLLRRMKSNVTPRRDTSATTTTSTTSTTTSTTTITAFVSNLTPVRRSKELHCSVACVAVVVVVVENIPRRSSSSRDYPLVVPFCPLAPPRIVRTGWWWRDDE